MAEEKIVRKFINKTNPERSLYLEIPSTKEIKKLEKDDCVYLEEKDIQALYRDKHYISWFNEGWLVEYEEKESGAFVPSVNAKTEADIDALLAKHFKTVEKEIKEITSVNTLKRIKDRAFELNKPVNVIKSISDRMDFVQLNKEEEINKLLGK